MSTFDLENPDNKPGDALRDEAANLLELLYGRPKIEKRVCGKKSDIYFQIPNFGKPFSLVVDAKDYGKKLQRADVSSIWADYSGIVKQLRPAALLIVTRHGLTTDAQAFVDDEQSEIRHQTIWELENETLGLTDYHRHLAEIFDERRLSEYYIEARARAARYDDAQERALEPTIVRLFDAVLSWIGTDDQAPLAILGGYGAGKSSLARRIVSHQAQLALSDALARRPVLIKLGAFGQYASLEGILGAMFGHEFPTRTTFNIRHFWKLNKKGRLLIVLDGFDEMKHAMSWPDFRSQVMDLNRLTEGSAKVILLGRPSAFLTHDEHVHVLRGRKRFNDGWRTLQGWPEFREFDLESFDAAEREQFVRRYLTAWGQGRQSQDWIDTRAVEVNQLADRDREVFAKPVHAKILTDLALDRNVDLAQFVGGVSRWSLYDTFFSALAEREAEKEARRIVDERRRRLFLQDLAYWLWTKKGGSVAFHAADIPEELVADHESDDIEAAKREFLTGAALEKKSGDLYFFGHRSFAEFLVAERMINIAPTGAVQSEYSLLARDGVLTFLREAPNQSFVKVWAEELPNAKGELHLGYLDFLGKQLGGTQELRAIFKRGSVWEDFLKAFSNRSISSDPDHIDAVATQMRTLNANAFWLLLQVWRRQAPFADKTKGASAEVAAALLDRVFSFGTYNEDQGTMAVAPEADNARAVARIALPRMENSTSGRNLIFNAPALMRTQSEALSMLGFDIGLHEPHSMRAFGNVESLPWSRVLQSMTKSNAEKAAAYFRRQEDWKGVYTKEVKPPSRGPSGQGTRMRRRRH